MDKNRFFSIGKLSKLTGVHIQSLRYYADLGILLPAYVNPETKYRYYTFSQMRVVEAIQYCVELGIPLVRFQDFLEDGGKINYHKLIGYGEKVADEKMRRMRERLQLLENMQQEVCHAGECHTDYFITSYMPEKYYWVHPYDGTLMSSEYDKAMYRLVSEVQSNGIRAGYNSGQLMLCKNDMTAVYMFVEIKAGPEQMSYYPQIIQIPSGDYLCRAVKENNIKKAPEIFSELFAKPYEKTVIETELSTEVYCYSSPAFELRCSLPKTSA